MFSVLIVAAVILLTIYIIKQIRRPPNYPPGPSWLPFVGNLPELRKLSRKNGGQHLAFSELSETYKSNVLGLKLGKDYVVVVFSYPAIKAVLTGQEYEGRPDNFFIRLRSMGTRKGVTCTDGELWKTQRTFVTTHLRNLGFGKKPMEKMVRAEVSELLTILEGNGHGEMQVGRILAPAVINILWTLTSGSRIDRADPRLAKLLNLLSARSRAFDISGGTLSLHPWFRLIAPEKSGYNLIRRLNEDLRTLFLDTIHEHYRSWFEGRDDDLIYSFITEMKAANGTKTTFDEDQLIMVCFDIFIAGSQTTSNTLDFAFLMMILYPDVQRKVQTYLDKTFNSTSDINYSDRHSVPYVEAVLLEVQRYCHVTPIIGPRRVVRDTILQGYTIPKETTVLISAYSVHNDKEYWKDPEAFRPERFLDDNGILSVHDWLIPFGLGRRRCLGEVLVRHCIFVLFAEVLRKYTISLLPGTKRPTGIPVAGITLSPENYRAKFTARR